MYYGLAPRKISYRDWEKQNPETIAQLEDLVKHIAIIPIEREGEALTLAADIGKILRFVTGRDTDNYVIMALNGLFDKADRHVAARFRGIREEIPGEELRMVLEMKHLPKQKLEQISKFRDTPEGLRLMDTLQFRAAQVHLDIMDDYEAKVRAMITIFRNILRVLNELIMAKMISSYQRPETEQLYFPERKRALVHAIYLHEKEMELGPSTGIFMTKVPRETLYFYEARDVVSRYINNDLKNNPTTDPYTKSFRKLIGSKIGDHGKCSVCQVAPVQGSCTDCHQALCRSCYDKH